MLEPSDTENFKMSPATTQERINLKRLAHVYYTHSNWDAACQFLHDFGLIPVEGYDQSPGVIYYRGYGPEPFVYCATKGDEDEFGGGAWIVDSMADLELAARILPHASDVFDLKTPGGGKCVSFQDPVDGFKFHLIYGQTSRDSSDDFKELPLNFPNNKHRPVNKTQRMEKGPAPVHKIGHFGLCVTNYEQTFNFFTSNFNFKPSDIIYNKEGKDITTFLHLDRGSEAVDHHVFFFFEGPVAHVHHSSFEVHDFDVQLLGHHWLREKNYESAWGVGRHVAGSQIFDYW